MIRETTKCNVITQSIKAFKQPSNNNSPKGKSAV
jgi:hypothetical protein